MSQCLFALLPKASSPYAGTLQLRQKKVLANKKKYTLSFGNMFVERKHDDDAKESLDRKVPQ